MHKPMTIIDDAANRRIQSYFANARSKDEVVFAFSEGYCLGMHKSRWLQNMDGRVPPQQTKNAVNIGALVAMNTCSAAWAIKISLVDNPLFSLNGHGGGTSPATSKHLINQVYETTAKNVGDLFVPAQLAIAGKADAAGSAAARLVALRGLASKNRSTGTIADWLSVVVDMTKRKRNVRGAQLAGKVVGCIVPCGGFLATPIVSYLKSGKASLEFTCIATAIELHWRASVEQRLGGQGPATRILTGLFRLRGARRLVSESEVNSFVKEPAGWLPIKDTLLSV